MLVKTRLMIFYRLKLVFGTAPLTTTSKKVFRTRLCPFWICACIFPRLNCMVPCGDIDGQVILRQLQTKLRDAATFPAYWEYLQNKFHWISSKPTCIQWKVHQLANQHLTHSECRIINKFIHEWLPLMDRYHVLSSSQNKQCPSCQREIETIDHFLNCSHPERQQIWTKLHDSVFRLHVKQNAPHSTIMQWPMDYILVKEHLQ